MKIFITLIFLTIPSLAISEEIRVWVSSEEVKGLNVASYEELEKSGISPHPCGYVKSIESATLPPPDSNEYISGTEKVYEFDPEGKIINQWAMPVDSYLYAVSGEAIIVRKGLGAIAISREGTIYSNNQKAVQPKLYECPQPIKKMYGNSAYVRCTEHKDIGNNKSRYFVYEGVCT